MARIAVIGAGAAGTMAAIFAAESAPPGTEVLLLERTKDGGRKILISGGGRCNILPAQIDESRFVTDSPRHLLRRMVRSWPLREQIAFFQNTIGLPLLEETASAKLFPASNSARDVRDRLLAHAHRVGVKLITNTEVIDYAPSGSKWAITTSAGAHRVTTHLLDADAIIVATGGLSVPNTGSDGRGLLIAERLGHTIRTLYPALTPLIAKPAPLAALAGVSLRVNITARAPQLEASADGGFLFTHAGYSGPAVLDVSHVAVRSRQMNSPARLTVRWSPLDDKAWEIALKPRGARNILHAVAEHLPHRLAEALLISAGIRPDLSLSQLNRDARLRLIDVLVRSSLPWTGDEGYKKAEVTGGGVLLSEIDPQTMESRKRQRLFFCGEMLDAFGPIGGYNFLWAWATGRAAGIGAAKMLC
jgi:predicted Rossmann fold flavoprotein